MKIKTESIGYLPLAFFTMFWAAQAVSLFGDRLNNFSLMALVNMYSHKPSMTLASFYLAMSLPLYLLAPFIGAMLDRLNKRWVLVTTDICRGVLSCVIPIAFLKTGHFFPVMAIVFLLATGNLFFLPAKSALIPELVPPSQLVRVNSILWAAGIVGVIGGFLGGGVIFDYFSWPACFYIDGITYFTSAVLLLGIALHGRKRSAGEAPRKVYHPGLRTAIIEGVQAIKSTPALIRPLGVQCLVFIGAGGFSVLALALIKERSAAGSSMGLSVAGIAIGLGMGLGSLLASALGSARRSREHLESGLFIMLLPAAALMLFGPGLATIIVAALIVGFAVSPLVIISEAELQRESGETMRGRIFSFREILARSFFIASAFGFSALGELLEKNVVLAILGLFLACMGLIWINVPRWRTVPPGADG
jgi:DHA3 family macrolide efflux protein-like MFS transporter